MFKSLFTKKATLTIVLKNPKNMARYELRKLAQQARYRMNTMIKKGHLCEVEMELDGDFLDVVSVKS